MSQEGEEKEINMDLDGLLPREQSNKKSEEKLKNEEKERIQKVTEQRGKRQTEEIVMATFPYRIHALEKKTGEAPDVTEIVHQFFRALKEVDMHERI